MATGRTLEKWIRVYCDGYDLSGMGRTIGPLAWLFDDVDLTAPMSDAAKGSLPNLCNISPGTYNGVLQSTTDSGTEISKIQGAGVGRDIMIPCGIRAEPAAGDQVFCCKATHSGFGVVESGGAMTISGTFGAWDVSDLPSYPIPWGQLITAKSTITGTGNQTGVNTGQDTARGGYMMYQVFTGTSGTWTLHLEDSPDNISYTDVEGLTVTVAAASIPCAGIIQTTAITTQIEGYVRLVATEDVAGSIVLAVALVRG
jgi:hypothetical protein